MKVKSIKELQKLLKKQVKEGLEKGKDEIEDIVHENSEYIYNEFESRAKHPYPRRFDKNGFADEDNIVSTPIVDTANGGLGYTVTNDTLANGDDKGKPLDYYITEGIYKWDTELPPPRPFMERARQDIIEDGIIKRQVKESLKKIGKVK